MKPFSINQERKKYVLDAVETGDTFQVWGLGSFGGNLNCIKYLCEIGKKVRLFEQKKREELKDSWDLLKPYHHLIDDHWEQDVVCFDRNFLLFITPAIPPHHENLVDFPEDKVCIELELALCLIDEKETGIHTVIGSVGKSTCASLMAHILNTRVYGNIGRSFIEDIDILKESCVLEISSFQLHYMEQLEYIPSSFLCTPIDDHHANWHGGVEAYQQTKLKAVKRWMQTDCPFVNMNQEEFVEPYQGSISMLGEHNRLNANAVKLLLMQNGVDEFKINEGIQNFKGLEHRLESVVAKPFTIINDSKATSMNACIEALKCFRKSVTLILHNFNEENCIGEFLELIQNNQHKLILIAKDAVVDTEVNKTYYENLESFFKQEVWNEYGEGSVLLFSPSAPSYGQYKHYAERGDHFKKLVTEYIVSK